MQGSGGAQFNLGLCYENGSGVLRSVGSEVGVEKVRAGWV
ncbi:MAG: hypothetical protein WCP45_00145 [Verrucomicrobiota bacterium]